MTINVRAKGQTGEREVADALNAQAYLIHQKLGVPFSFADHGAQRNQMQSAIGGCDLTNTWGLAIEIKRQEALSIETWWEQCVASAHRAQEDPVLIFRQNGKKWRVIMQGAIALPPSPALLPWMLTRVEISWDEFLIYYKERIARMLAIRLSAQEQD